MPDAIFPSDFLWGTATASYQIEGAVHDGSRGESIWDRFSHTPGKVLNGDTGDIACDHYHRYRDDVDIMEELGIGAYRFSIAWPRIFPEGRGKLNSAGMDFYENLVDTLLAKNIAPAVTLYHWDLPQALEDKGGWPARDTADYFTDYACTVFERLGDRVKMWITHNEPWVTAFLGYDLGMHAPGIRDKAKALRASHHLLLSHAKAVQVYRGLGQNGKIGITLNLAPAYAQHDTAEDEQAAVLSDGYLNRWFLDPVFKGTYPEDMAKIYRERYDAPDIGDGDLELMQSSTIDFLGVNYDSRKLVTRPEKPEDLFRDVKPQGAEFTAMGWEIFPEGLYALLTRLDGDYGRPELYITENGAAFEDARTSEGRIEDEDRIDYLRGHFEQAHRAIQDGVNLKGYYVWSLMDNFEWAFGYSRRFGLIYVDFDDLTRTWKQSARWYRDVIARGGV